MKSTQKEGKRGIPYLLKSSSPHQTEGSLEEHIATDITQLVGETPLIELKQITRKDTVNAWIVGKLESYQPLCSVKDRSALRSLVMTTQNSRFCVLIVLYVCMQCLEAIIA